MSLVVRGRVLRALLALPLLAPSRLRPRVGLRHREPGRPGHGLRRRLRRAGRRPLRHLLQRGRHRLPEGQAALRGRRLRRRLSTDFTGSGPYPAAGTLEKSDRGLGVLPTLYYSQQVGERRYVGLGVSRPFGFKSQWDNPDTFTGRYICLECQISSWSINPTIAYKVADRFAVGAGLDVRFASFKTRRAACRRAPTPSRCRPTSRSCTLDSGTDTGVGFNVGLLASPTENLSIGLSYRHKVAIDHGAQAELRPDPDRQHGGGRRGGPGPARARSPPR